MMNDSIPSDGHQPVILAVLAHPDDESFGMGGTLALYSHRGAKVYLVCATRGEAGDVEEEHLRGFASVAERREAELRCAAEKLGLQQVFFLDYRDSGMEGSKDNLNPESLYQAPMDEVVAKVAHYIRMLEPNVVITFDPIGGYRHPDHIKIHLATVKAFEEAASPSFVDLEGLAPYQAEKMYFHTMPHTLLRLMVRAMPLFGQDPTKMGRNKDIDLKSIAEVSFPTHAVIDYRPVSQLRDEAAGCHASQGGGLTSGLAGWVRKWFASRETFMRAYPEPENGVVERDLLAGVNGHKTRIKEEASK